MVFLDKMKKILYRIKRAGNSLFTYDCVSCGKAARGKCLCKSCIEKISPAPNYGNNVSFAYYYEGPAKDVLLQYKFEKDSEFCFDTLCDWLLEGYEKTGRRDFDAAVPVPAFGYNKTRLSELCEKFSLLADIPFIPDLLSKIRKTEKQHNLPASERRTNLIGAFKADSSAAGKKILLVDDIYTTGSTAMECANALYDAGAEEVFVLTIFKTKFSG